MRMLVSNKALKKKGSRAGGRGMIKKSGGAG